MYHDSPNRAPLSAKFLSVKAPPRSAKARSVKALGKFCP